MAAIRWDNIDAPNFATSGALLDSADRSMGSLFSTLGGMVKTTNDLEQTNWNTQRTNATNDAFAKIMGISDAKQFEEAQRNGLYQQLIGDGSVPIDKKAVMAGIDSRLPLLKNREVAGINYDNAMTDQAQQGLRQQAGMALLNGDMAGFKTAVGGLRDPSSFVTAGMNQQHYADQQAQAKAAFDLKKSLIDAQIGLANAKAGDPDNFAQSGTGGVGKGGSGGKAGNKPEMSEEELAKHNMDKLEAERIKGLMKPYTLEASAKYIKDTVKDQHIAEGALSGLSDLPPKGYLMPDGTYRQPTQEIIQAAVGKVNSSPGIATRLWRGGIEMLPFTSSNRNTVFVGEEVEKLMSNPDIQERLMRGDSLAETLATDMVGTQEAAKKAGVRPNRPLTQGGDTSPGAAQPDNVAAFMNNSRVREFVTGGSRDVASVDPRTAPAANQVPVVPVQARPVGLTYNQLMGGTDPKKEMSANPPTSTPLISKEDKPSASVGLSLGSSGSITSTHPDTIKIPEVDWAKPQVIQQAAPGAIPKGGGERAVVTYVEDGDTAKLLRGNGSQVNCRIDKIDAPETSKSNGKPGQPFGDQAKKTLQGMIDNKEVTLRITRPEDKWGRVGCQIEVEGSNVDLAMVQAGAAWLYRRYANDSNLVKAEQEARTAKRGLWSEPSPVNPENFRRSLEKAREGR